MKNFLVILLLLGGAIALVGRLLTAMPGLAFTGALPALTEEEAECAESLRAHVETIGRDIGARGTHAPDKLVAAEDYLTQRLRQAGLPPESFRYDCGGQSAGDLVSEIPGTRARDVIVVVGAHYDSASRSPGADDDASGCAVLLELADAIGGTAYERTLRFVLFSNGAPPRGGTPASGSRAYAKAAREKGEKIVLMLSLDSLGSFRTAPKTQSVPFPFQACYPDRGDFVAFVGDLSSRTNLARSLETFRKVAKFPSEGLVLPGWTPGFADSDDASFRAEGFPALRITDTGTWRHVHSGTISDTSDRLDYESMARVTLGLARMISELVQKRVDLRP